MVPDNDLSDVEQKRILSTVTRRKLMWTRQIRYAQGGRLMNNFDVKGDGN
jgi:hypothetical protein